jgi:hypothetical protein
VIAWHHLVGLAIPHDGEKGWNPVNADQIDQD